MRRTPLLGIAVCCLGCDVGPRVSAARGDGGGDAATPSPDAWSVPALPDGGGKVPDASATCMRSIDLKAVTLARPVPFDVVVVADNSDSLSWSRASLSAGLENLLSRVHGHEARFFVLTSTQYGASSQAAVSPITGKELVAWRDPVTGAPHARPVTEYSRACTGENGAPIECPVYPQALRLNDFTLTGTWQLEMPAPVAAITPAMTVAELAAEQKKIADAVLALGGGGARQEQPICTLNRLLAQRPERLPKHAVFVVLADEDDTSLPEACLSGHVARREPGMAQVLERCQADCPQYRYEAHRNETTEHITFGCVPVDDTGTAHPEKTTYQDVRTFREGCKPGSKDCPAAEAARAASTCGVGQLVRNCKLGCFEEGGSACAVIRPDNSVDICKLPFEYSGQTYNNVPDLCSRTRGPGWGNCTVTGLRPRMVPGSSTRETSTPVVAGATTQHMIDAFKTGADRVFGPGNYFVEAIVLDPAFTCPVQPGQSYSPNLRRLATSAQDVFSLCADYAPALQRIARFAQVLIQSEYPLELDAYEKVEAVTVTTETGARRTLPAADYRYDRPAKVLRFNPGVLGARDEALAVNVARYCERIVE